MTFAEFFNKKKIHVDSLAIDNPELAKELLVHFDLMGEKSFDHTKKYLFNKWRRMYPLPKQVEE